MSAPVKAAAMSVVSVLVSSCVRYLFVADGTPTEPKRAAFSFSVTCFSFKNWFLLWKSRRVAVEALVKFLKITLVTPDLHGSG